MSTLARSSALITLAMCAVPLAGSVQGAVIYGNFSGNDVIYQGVTETPMQLPGPTPTELYGPPTVAGDSLLFNPTDFVVGASGGTSEFQDAHLTTDIVPIKPATLKSISLTEGGGWAVGGGTAATTALDSLLVNQLFITSVNGVSVNPIVVPPVITFTDTNSGSATVTKTPTTIEFASAGGFSTGTWDGTASFNIPAALAAAGLSGQVTGLTLDLDNQLAVTSETNSESYIDKKFFDITSTTGSPVPEPATGTAIVLGAIGMLSRRRQRLA